MGFQQSGGKWPYLFSTVKSRGKLEGVADAQMLSPESFIKPFPRVASPPEGCLRITVSLLNGGTPVFKPLNDLWWGEPWQVYFSSTPRILMSLVLTYQRLDVGRQIDHAAAGTVPGQSSLSGISLFFIKLFFICFCFIHFSSFQISLLTQLHVLSLCLCLFLNNKNENNGTSLGRPPCLGVVGQTPTHPMAFVWACAFCLGFGGFAGGGGFVEGRFAFRFHLMGWLLGSHMSNDLLVSPTLSVQVQN